MGKWSYRSFASKKSGWQNDKQGWESHTVAPQKARLLVGGYLLLIKKLKLDFQLKSSSDWNGKNVLDVGAGAGYISRALLEQGCTVLSTEHTEEGVELIKKHNPDLETGIFDIASSSSNIDIGKKFNLIICRELYPFTRVNCFESQVDSLNNILNFLDDNGVLLLIGSTVSHPHCADYKLLFNTLNNDKDYQYYGGYAEPFISRKRILNLGIFFVKITSFCLSVLTPLISRIMGRGYADIKVYVIKKNAEL